MSVDVEKGSNISEYDGLARMPLHNAGVCMFVTVLMCGLNKCIWKIRLYT